MDIPMSLITADFERYARTLDDVIFSETARPFYEAMSGGLMWGDEQSEIPFSELGWFRAALAYRTSVILGQPRNELESIWNALRRFAPNWPGFRAERCSPSPELVELVNKEKKSMARLLDRTNAAVSGKWKPLSGTKA